MSSKKQHQKSNKKIKAPYGYGGVRPSRALGQNFLTDENVIDVIVDNCGADSDALVIEIGPGTGALTLPLAEKAGHLTAIELDEELIEPLRVKLFGYDNSEVVKEDILKTDLDALIDDRLKTYGLSKVHVVGNLPYYITTPIIAGLLETQTKINSITVMMQKEVGDRIAAEPGTRASGAITYTVHYYAEAEKLVDVPRECFYPSPKVDSTVLILNIRDEAPVRVRDKDFMFACIKAGFSQRRKTILNSLSNMPDFDKQSIAASLKRAGIDQNRRAESLSLEEFAKLSDCLQEE